MYSYRTKAVLISSVIVLLAGMIGYGLGISRILITQNEQLITTNQTNTNEEKITEEISEGRSSGDGCSDADLIGSMTPDDPNDLILPSALHWSHGLPTELLSPVSLAYGEMISKGYKLDNEERAEEFFNHALIDLVGDEKPEIVVDYLPFSGTGGHSFTIYQRKDANWRKIGGFLGGFFAYRDKNFDHLNVYGRYGDSYTHFIFDYDSKTHLYRQVESNDIPHEIIHISPMYCFFRSLVNYEIQ